MEEEIVEEIGKDIKDKKTMTKEYEGKINKRIFSNILIAVLILIYLIIVILGSNNIENDIFIVDLKVCSIVIALLSIFILERSYRRADGRLCIYGIETLLLAILTLVGVYVFQISKDTFAPIVSVLAIIIPIYYLIKSIGIYVKGKKDYVRSQNDISEIVKEDLPETVETKRRRDVLESQMEEYNRLNNEVESEEKEEEKEPEVYDDEDDNNMEEDNDIEEDDDEDPYPRLVKPNSRVIKTSSRKVDVSVGFDDEEEDEEEELIIFNDEYREKKAGVKATPEKETTDKTTKKTIEDEETKPKTTRKTTTKSKEVEEKPATKKTTTKKATTKKTVKDEETKPKTTRKTTTKSKEVEEKPATKKTTAKKTTTKKTTTTRKKDGETTVE